MAQRNDGKKIRMVLLFLILAYLLFSGYQFLTSAVRSAEVHKNNLETRLNRI